MPERTSRRYRDVATCYVSDILCVRTAGVWGGKLACEVVVPPWAWVDPIGGDSDRFGSSSYKFGADSESWPELRTLRLRLLPSA
jgi:hypothetical protein